MRLDSRSGLRGIVVNAETGRPIPFVIWADIPDDPAQPGDFEAWRSDPDRAKRHGATAEQLAALRYRGRARLRFVPAAPVYGRKASDPRDLAGSLEDARRRLVEPKLLIAGEECDEPKCHRLSAWRVVDEVEIEPEADGEGRQHERAVVTRVRNYCDRHYRLPTFKNVRGVEREAPIGLARPQW